MMGPMAVDTTGGFGVIYVQEVVDFIRVRTKERGEKAV
jgi:nitrogen regulatory protein PII